MRFGFNPEKTLANAEKCVQQGKFAQAIELYEKVLPHQPNNLNLRNNLGDLYVRQGRNADAVRLFLEVAEQLEQQGITPRVAAVLKKVLRLDPNAPGVQQRLAQCLVAQGIHGEARMLLLSLAERAEQAGDWRQAVTALGQIASLDPDQPRLRVRLARARVHAGDRAQAQTELLNAAKLMLDKKDWEGVEAALHELEALDSTAPGFQLIRARSLLAQGKPEEALAALPDVSHIKDLGAEGAGLWRVACDCGDYDRALELARAALRAGNAIAAQVGQWFIEHKQIDQAMAWIRSDPELFRRGDLEPIWLELLQAINTVEPEYVPCLETWLELVKEDRRSRRHVRLRLAPAYEHAGDLEKAASCYRELLDEDPGNPDYARELHRLQVELGLVEPEPEPPLATPAATPAAGETAAEADTAGAPAEFSITPVAAEADDTALGAAPAAPPPAASAPPATAAPSAVTPAAPAARSRAVELDLSSEWGDAAESDLEARLSEISFYLANDMLDEADRALAKQRHLHPDEPRLGALTDQLRRARAGAAAHPAPAAPAKPAPPAAAAAAAAAAAVPLEVASAAPPSAPAAAAGAGGLLDEVFQEFRSAVEQTETQDKSDPEARYNLGVAYKEMGLSEEAIAELQKAFAGWKARGGPAARMLSCGATIALCFQEANMPELALQWYETTLAQAQLSPRDALGPRFEAAKLLEQLGRKDEALAYYRQVYAEDVDYQDVAECVRRLGK
ncbi:MAG TPA: tetratricopeptide repeat protein [Terriglobales bacterium]|nr:tetratricopeptide repeat protein [Terriglobales bacterium]